MTECSAFRPSIPTHRWKQVAVLLPSNRCISTLSVRSSVPWWMWEKRLTFFPVRCDVAKRRSSASGSSPRLYDSATALALGLTIGWSTVFPIRSPSRYTSRSSPRRLSKYSSGLLILMRSLLP